MASPADQHPPRADDPHAMRPVPAKNGTLILGGDVGGTKTWLGIFRAAGADAAAPLTLEHAEKFSSPSAGGLDDLVAAFLADKTEHIDFACFGLPGPVNGSHAKLVNQNVLVIAHFVLSSIQSTPRAGFSQGGVV